MDPMTMALISAGSNVLGKAVTTPPAGPSNAVMSAPFDSVFDSSNWNVNFGSGGITSTATKTVSDVTPGLPGAGGAALNIGAYMPYILLGLGALVMVKLVTKL